MAHFAHTAWVWAGGREVVGKATNLLGSGLEHGILVCVLKILDGVDILDHAFSTTQS